MALKTLVYVSGINNLSDARYCAGMGVEMMGFNFNPDGAGYISLETFKEIAGWISGVSWIGEFEDMDSMSIARAINEFEPDFIQVKDFSNLNSLQSLNIPIILKVNIGNFDSLEVLNDFFESNKNLVSYFLISQDVHLDNKALIELNGLASTYPVILGSGLTSENINEILNFSNFKGISLPGGDEIRPGYKDFDELASILEAIEIDDTY